MAIIRCRECRGKVSSKASVCPHCGNPNVLPTPEQRKSDIKALKIFGLVTLALVLAMGSCIVKNASTPVPAKNTSVPSASTATADPWADLSNRSKFEINAQTAVLSQLKDPDSANFRNVRFHLGSDKVPAVCGEVNSKNGFGGYTGFHRWVTAVTTEFTVIDDGSKEFKKSWARFCGS